MARSRPTYTQVSSLVEVRRIALDPAGIVVQTRDLVGTFHASQLIFWDEIRAIYVWSRPNWALLIGGWVIALVLVVLGLATTGNFIATAAAVSVALGVAVLAYFGSVRWLRIPWMRIDSAQGPLQFPAQRRGFTDALVEAVMGGLGCLGVWVCGCMGEADTHTPTHPYTQTP